MPRYVMLAQASDVSSANILAFGQDGDSAVEEIISATGGRVEARLVLVGRYDLLYVIDFEDDVGALAFSLRAQAGGLYVEALRAYAPQELDAARAMLPEAVEYRKQALAHEES